MYSLKQQNNHKRNILRTITVIFVLLVLGAAWYARVTYTNGLKPVSSVQKTAIVTIKTGSSVHNVALLLKQKSLIRSAAAFEWYVRTNNVRDKLKAGSYAFTPSMSVQEIVDRIVTGKVASDLFTILPAKRLDEVQTAFIKAGFAAIDVRAAFDPGQYEDHPALAGKPQTASLEGYLYPESFQKTADSTPQSIISASLDEMAQALTPDIKAGITRQGLSIHEGVILASILEKEVASDSDRSKAAQVFLRRLKQGMVLGSDVTAYYGADNAHLAHSVLTDTAYNTRIHAGLPPGPISNVSVSSLKAVAFPASTNYLYFVAGDDGITYFSNTLQEHDAAALAHCKKLCQE